MRLIVPFTNREEISLLKELGVSALLLETSCWTRTSTHPYSLTECIELISLIHQEKMMAYVSFNTLIHEAEGTSLGQWLNALNDAGADAFVAFDLTVAVVAQSLGIHRKVIYQPGTFNTHSRFAKSLLSLDLKGITLSKEATVDEIIAIAAANPQLSLSLVGHGAIEMFYSRRALLSNHARHQQQPLITSERLWLQEENRLEHLYPIVEDQFGTTIFRPKKLASFAFLTELTPWISEWFLSRLFLDDSECYAAIEAYLSNDDTRFIAQYGHDYDDGFYHQKTGMKKQVGR